jgi:acyl-CoA thioesterase-2
MLDQLIRVLDPQPTAPGEYTGANMHPRAARVYGGQVLAQCIRAATDTVDDDRDIHSQHAYFLRPGRPSEPIRLAVEIARDGVSFSSRRVVASQRGKPILVSSMSFQQPSRGDDFQLAMPSVPPPEELVSERQLALETDRVCEEFMITTGEDLDVRVVEPIDWEHPVPREPKLQVWMKTTGPVPAVRGLQQALLAYLSDAFLIDVCLIAHGRHFHEPGLQVASLDHALWLHQPCRADEWLLHIVEAEAIGGGRGLARGRFYDRQGSLIASTMQQGVMRER